VTTTGTPWPPARGREAAGDRREPLLGPELRWPAGAGIDEHRRGGQPFVGEPAFDPLLAHRPARHVERLARGADAERGEQVARALDDMRGGR